MSEEEKKQYEKWREKKFKMCGYTEVPKVDWDRPHLTEQELREYIKEAELAKFSWEKDKEQE